jgi:hypothetical protein
MSALDDLIYGIQNGRIGRAGGGELYVCQIEVKLQQLAAKELSDLRVEHEQLKKINKDNIAAHVHNERFMAGLNDECTRRIRDLEQKNKDLLQRVEVMNKLIYPATQLSNLRYELLEIETQNIRLRKELVEADKIIEYVVVCDETEQEFELQRLLDWQNKHTRVTP